MMSARMSVGDQIKQATKGSDLELELAGQIATIGKTRGLRREWRFHPIRLWRFDFAYPHLKLAIEVEGGTWNGGRHVRPQAFEDDCVKYSTAAALGWYVVRFTGAMVKDGRAIALIEKLLISCRFWPKVSYSDDPDGCWDWTAHLNSDGYGSLKIGERNVGAHRVSYEIHHGPIPEGLIVRHSCDRPICVNPDHLGIGTHLDNARDRDSRARGSRGDKVPYENRARGANVNSARLTEEQVKVILQRLAQGERQVDIAADFGVGKALISRIATGKTWQHVTGSMVTSGQAIELIAHALA